MNNPNKFTYTYAAPTQDERKTIEEIRKKYQPKPTSSTTAFARLKKLDNKVQRIPETLAISLGIIGTLVFGLGLTCILQWQLLALGVVVAFIGVFPVGFAYPLYRYSHKKLTEKYGAEILALSSKLLSEKEQATQETSFTNL